jgi:NAD(P)-dependent dehydrogenase (short-subunit alcohol dehydrogenase family)
MELGRGAAIVTGAAGGIGAAVAHRLAAEGMAVVLADLDDVGLHRVRDDIQSARPGARLAVVAGDVAEPSHHAEVVAAAEDLGAGDGGLRLSVLNAGVAVPGLGWEIPLEQWRLHVDVNLWGVVHGLRAALATMVPRDDGWVVAVSSGAGIVATPGLAPYVATKHAVVGLMESTFHELARIGSAIGVSVVCPGNIATAMPDRSWSIAAAEGLGAPVVPDGEAEVVAGLESSIRSGVAAGAAPHTVSDAIVDALAGGRFWVLPQPELAWAATDRMARLAAGDPPVDLLG